MNIFWWALAVLVAIALPLRGSAQVVSGSAVAGPLRVYTDCDFCDENFLRMELSFVDHVRDRVGADVHVLVTRQGTGGGGREVTLTFIGLRGFVGEQDTLRYFEANDATDDERRRELARTLKIGLVPFLARTALAPYLDVTVSTGTGAAPPAAPATDPWNYWVYRLSVNGFMNGESRQNFGNYQGSASANRTTEQWKASLSLNGSTSRSRFEIDDSTTVSSSLHSYGLSTLIVKSVADQISAGGRASLSASNFVNQKLAFRLAPAAEYSLYPYSESTRRLVTLLYSIGAIHVLYEEETLYGRTAETLAFEALQLSYDVTQPWGSLDVEFEASHYLHDPWKRYNLSSDGRIDVRLFKGLSLNVGGSVAYVRDQLYLPAGGSTEEEILLRRRQLETSYRYFMNFGVSYSFGSVLNNVVNPRLRF